MILVYNYTYIKFNISFRKRQIYNIYYSIKLNLEFKKDCFVTLVQSFGSCNKGIIGVLTHGYDGDHVIK